MSIPYVVMAKKFTMNEKFYSIVILDNIKVYYYRYIETKNGTLNVLLQKFLFINSLEVSGHDFI